MSRSACRASTAISRLTAAASHKVDRVPNSSNKKNVAITAPTTAPSVFKPYSAATSWRRASPRRVTPRAAAGNVPPITIVGTASTSALNTRRQIVPATSPRRDVPPTVT